MRGNKGSKQKDRRGTATKSVSEESLVFLVRRKIGQKGTPAQPHMKPAREAVEPLFLAEVEKVVERAARQVSHIK
jgi:hypothetical protein